MISKFTFSCDEFCVNSHWQKYLLPATAPYGRLNLEFRHAHACNSTLRSFVIIPVIFGKLFLNVKTNNVNLNSFI